MMKPTATAAYWASFSLSLLGNSIANVVLPVLTLTVTGSVAFAGAVALVNGVVTFLAGMLGGPLIDHFDRRLIAAAGDAISAISIGGLAYVATAHSLTPVWFMLMAVLSGLGDLPAWNSREAMVQNIALARGHGYRTLVGAREGVSGVAIIAGPGLAGVLMGLLEPGTVLWVTATLSLVSAVLIASTPREFGRLPAAPAAPDEPIPVEGFGVLSSLRAGMAYLMERRSALVRGLVTLNIGSIGLVTVLQGLLLPVLFVSAGEGDRAGFAIAVIGAGLLVGAIACTALNKTVPGRIIILGALALNVVTVAALAHGTGTTAILVFAFLFGLTSSGLGTVTGILSYEVLRPDKRGVVNGMQNSAGMVVGPLLLAAFALFISRFGIPAGGWALAIIWGAFALAVTLRSGLLDASAAPAGEPGAPVTPIGDV